VKEERCGEEPLPWAAEALNLKADDCLVPGLGQIVAMEEEEEEEEGWRWQGGILLAAILVSGEVKSKASTKQTTKPNGGLPLPLGWKECIYRGDGHGRKGPWTGYYSHILFWDSRMKGVGSSSTCSTSFRWWKEERES
jgi:hypothetical protein